MSASDLAWSRGHRVYEDVECPTCGAGIGERCHSVPGGWPIDHKHAARIRLHETTHPSARRDWS